MRKILSIGIAATLTAIAITAWATAGIQPQKRGQAPTVGIDVFALMLGTRILSTQRYEAF
jgi:hypothetical protein